LEIFVTLAASSLEKGVVMTVARDQTGLAHVLVTRNFGNSWDLQMNGLAPDSQPRSVLFHPTLPGTVFLGTVHDGVYRSDQYGSFWSPMSKGLPLDEKYVIVHSLTWSESDPPILFAGTDLDGTVWEYRH